MIKYGLAAKPLSEGNFSVEIPWVKISNDLQTWINGKLKELETVSSNPFEWEES